MSRTTPFDLKALAALKSRPKRFDYRDPTTPGLVLPDPGRLEGVLLGAPGSLEGGARSHRSSRGRAGR